MTIRPCAIVPSCNHHRAVGGIVTRLRERGLAVFVIDDGSDEPARSTLGALHDADNGVVVLRSERSRGKGAAVCDGFRLAAAAGFTHAVQVDADGQHDLAALPKFLALAEAYPEAVIAGRAVFDATVPRSRAIARWITHVWVWVETLSFRISDSMCGFRAYPLKTVAALLVVEPVGRRMDFDTEILVRLFWRGVPVVMQPIKVRYPAGNTSNFDALTDNWRITRMHSRLVLSMPFRLPGILRKRPPALEPASHWASLAERGMHWGVRFSAAACRLLGRRGSLVVLAPVVLFFYLTGGEQRRASRTFLRRVYSALGCAQPVGWLAGYRHFLSFAARSIDTFAGWTGALPADLVQPDDPTALRRMTEDPHGALLIVSHLGNSDIARALLDKATRDRLIVLVHTRHAENFNRVLARFNPDAVVQTVQVTELGPDTAIALRDRIERGHWVAIAGDRAPVSNKGRTASVEFLGHRARLPEGPIVLAALLGCPVYLLFCLSQDGSYRLSIELFAERIELPRAIRDTAIKGHVARYAKRLESCVLEHPFQWYNFFDFWAQ